MKKLIILCWMVGILVCGVFPAITQADEATSNRPIPQKLWQIGDSWRLQVDVYPPIADPYTGTLRREPAESRSFTMSVKVSGEEEINKIPCWRLDFIPDEAVPVLYFKEGVRVLVGKTTGMVHGFRDLHFDMDYTDSIVKVESITILYYPPRGYPLLFVPLFLDKNAVFENGGHTVEVRVGESSGEPPSHDVEVFWTRKSHFKQNNPRGQLYRQHWAEGAKWWNRYEYYVADKILMRARLIVDEPK